ncbi:MAG: hypothetical protein AAF665_04475 [Pseudomonadota bacterium]
MRTTLISGTTIAFAAADLSAGGSDGPVAEIVTFRLIDGADTAAFAEAANGMTGFLKETNAVSSRTLSCNADGVWTDHITWTSLSAAKSAASQLMAQPEAAPFISMIDGDTVQMTHAPILFVMPME